MHIVGAMGSMPCLNGSWQRKIELPSRLGLGTINVALFHGRTDLYQGMSPEFRYRDGKVLGTPPHSTPLVSRPPLIVFQILILLKGPLICYSKFTNMLTCI